MSKLKVALLEDNRKLLKELKENVEATGLAEAVAWATTSDEFIEKVISLKPEALLLDIDLGGDSMSGLDIVNQFKIPVLFVSGKTRDFYQNIEELNINSEVTIEHISKPITLEKLNKILPKFITEIRALSKAQYIYLDFGDTRRNKTSPNNIVYLCTDKAAGADSNNKLVFFDNKKSEMLIDFSFSKMEEKGFSKNKFITIHKSFRVNVDKIISYNVDTHEVQVEVYKSPGALEVASLPVSENFRDSVVQIKR